MNRRSLVIASLMLGLSIAGASAHAMGRQGGAPCMQGEGMQQGPCGGGPGSGGGQGMQRTPHGHMGVLGAAYRVDNLTADQRKQLDALADKERQQMQGKRGEMQAVHEALLRGDDAATIRPLAEKEGKLVTEMIMHQVELRDQVNHILTEAQRAQLKQTFNRGPRQGPGGPDGNGGPGR